MKRSRSSETEDSDDSNTGSRNSSENGEQNLSEDESDTKSPLTNDQIAAKLQELKSSKKEARRRKTELTGNVQTIRKELEEMKSTEEKILSKMSAMCISGRNQYSKGAIQQDFAAGIKELDQELAAEEDEENFNPDVEVRDYEEVARGLPVFCVSSPTSLHLLMESLQPARAITLIAH